MRIFTGLDLPTEVVHNLERLLERLRPTARIHWSHPANLHITTKFIGQFQAASFFLYQSTLRPSGSVYTKLAEFPLAKR